MTMTPEVKPRVRGPYEGLIPRTPSCPTLSPPLVSNNDSPPRKSSSSPVLFGSDQQLSPVKRALLSLSIQTESFVLQSPVKSSLKKFSYFRKHVTVRDPDEDDLAFQEGFIGFYINVTLEEEECFSLTQGEGERALSIFKEKFVNGHFIFSSASRTGEEAEKKSFTFRGKKELFHAVIGIASYRKLENDEAKKNKSLPIFTYDRDYVLLNWQPIIFEQNAIARGHCINFEESWERGHPQPPEKRLLYTHPFLSPGIESQFIGFCLPINFKQKELFYVKPQESDDSNERTRLALEKKLVGAHFTRKFLKGGFLLNTEAGKKYDCILKIINSRFLTTIPNVIVGVGEYRKLNEGMERSEIKAPYFKSQDELYSFISWQPIIFDCPYIIMGRGINFTDHGVNLTRGGNVIRQASTITFDNTGTPSDGQLESKATPKLDSELDAQFPLQNLHIGTIIKIDERIKELNKEINSKTCWALLFFYSWDKRIKNKKIKMRFLRELKSAYSKPRQGECAKDIVNKLADEYRSRGQLQDVMAGVKQHKTKDLMISLGYTQDKKLNIKPTGDSSSSSAPVAASMSN